MRYYNNKNTLQLRDKKFRRNSYLQAVCDTPITRITGYVSSLRIWVGDSPWNYNVACTGVNRVMLKTPPSPHRLYDLQDSLDKLMHFLPQLSDFVPLKNRFFSLRAHTD